MNNEITWKNTLHSGNKAILKWYMKSFAELAVEIGYPYMVWNGRVYSVTQGDAYIEIADTGLLEEDLT